MSLDTPSVGRWVVLVVAHYPDGSEGWSLQTWTSAGDFLDVMGPPQPPPRPGYQPRPPMASMTLEEMIETGVAVYHQRIGPAYSREDMTVHIYPFGNILEMFDAIGERLLATDGSIRDWQAPNVSASPHP